MSARGETPNPDLLIERGFLDPAALAEVFAAVRASVGSPATVYGRGDSGAVDERVRRTSRLSPPVEVEELVRRLLLARIREAGAHFGRNLSELEEPQFLRYGPGDFFVAHQDGNTGLLRSERESRLVSAVLFLNTQTEAPTPDTYGGGALVLHPRGAPAPPQARRRGRHAPPLSRRDHARSRAHHPRRTLHDCQLVQIKS